MDALEFFAYHPSTLRKKIPLFTMSVSAGIPVPVDHDIDREVDLNEFLVEHPAATFFARVKGDTMTDVGIHEGDVLIVDTIVEPFDGKLVVVIVNGDLAVKYYREIDGKIYLQSHDKSFIPQKISPFLEFTLIGVVTKIIHSI